MSEIAEEFYHKGMLRHSECDCCEFAAITIDHLTTEVEDLRNQLDSLYSGKTAVLPKTREHAKALLAVAEGCLNGAGTLQPLPSPPSASEKE